MLLLQKRVGFSYEKLAHLSKMGELSTALIYMKKTKLAKENANPQSADLKNGYSYKNLGPPCSFTPLII